MQAALNYQLIGEERMNNFCFQEAYNYMMPAAEAYVALVKTSKNPALVAKIKEKLPGLFDRVKHLIIS